VEVRAADGAFEVQASKAVVIASGSEAATLPDLPIDERRIVTSAGALSLTAAPRHLAVIGGGYVGLELGSVWRRLGSEVTVIEVLDRIASGVDSEMSTALQKVLEAQGFQFRLAHKVVGSRIEGEEVVLDVEPVGDGARGTIRADVVLVSIGRRPATAGLDLETVGIEPDRRGYIPVDEGFRTSAEGVYAIGDVIGGAMLAHKAEEEGIALAERLAGGAGHVDYGTIPAVVYTWPELASVGRTEEDLKAAGVDYRVGRFPFSANAMAKARLEKNGLVKVLADAATDKILGVHILGPEAGGLIHEAVAAMQFGAAAEDLARTSHAHPTLPEALREACLAVADRTIHL
jgi:dihydrolipoamide dehydrogenase